MTAVVHEVPGQGYRAVCDDDACAITAAGPTYTLTTRWRTWIWSETRAASLATDHNRARHGAR